VRQPRTGTNPSRIGSSRAAFGKLTARQIAGAVVPDHPVNPDIDLLEGRFYIDDPHPKYAWMRAHAPVYFDERNGVWGLASYAAVLGAASRRGSRTREASVPTTGRSR
jgi:hypothetical protein